MKEYVNGLFIKELREKNNLTQQELADKLFVSPKTISKWECMKGYPDITILKSLSTALNVSVNELINGFSIQNKNHIANMRKIKFYVCPKCGNVITSVGQVNISCHGIDLFPLIPKPFNDSHLASVETIEDELFIKIYHDMTKEHYISFIAALGGDKLEIHKLYPESEASCRFKKIGVNDILFYCNKEGLFYID